VIIIMFCSIFSFSLLFKNLIQIYFIDDKIVMEFM